MRVLIVGAGGMLGRDTAFAWRDAHPVSVDYPAVDLTDRDSVRSVVASAKPGIILNCTGYTAVDDAETHEAEAEALNGTGAGYLAEAAREAGALLVHYSTDYVFDGTKSGGYDEGDAPRPLSAYGRTKLRGENLLKASGARYYLVRTSWLYGRHGKNFVGTMLNLAHSGKSLRVVNDQVGKPTYTVDVATATRSLIFDRAPEGIYHLVNENATSWYDFAVEIFRQVGTSVVVEPVPSSEVPRPAPRPACSALRNTKRPPLRAWRAALADYLTIGGRRSEVGGRKQQPE